jgi:hypothetical protein
MTEGKEQFIQVDIKDVCRSPSIRVTLKVASSNVTRDVKKIIFFDNRIESLLLAQNVSSYNFDRTVNRCDISSGFSV